MEAIADLALQQTEREREKQQQAETAKVLAAMMERLPERVGPPASNDAVPPLGDELEPPPTIVVSLMVPPVIPPLINDRWLLSTFSGLQPSYVSEFIRPQGRRRLARGARADFRCYGMYIRGEVPFGNLHTQGRRPHLVEVSTKDLGDERPAIGLDRLLG